VCWAASFDAPGAFELEALTNRDAKKPATTLPVTVSQG
jgi:hypothetical protein